MMRGLSGKAVLVTGAAGGIGAATCRRFLDEGCRVAALDHNSGALATLATENKDLTTLDADVTDRPTLDAALAAAETALGGLDVVINNHGISQRHGFLDIDPADWRRTLEVNLTGVFQVGQAGGRRMVAGRGGVIINMGSVSGQVGIPLYAAYNASKAAVIELTKTMALELAPAVRAVAVCPGYVLTPMQEAEYTPAMMEALNAKVPMRRHARPEEIAAVFAFLASEEAPFVTGSALVIDGGETAGGLCSR